MKANNILPFNFLSSLHSSNIRKSKVSLESDEAHETKRGREAKLFAKKKQRLRLACSDSNQSSPLSEFLQHPSGVESVLNRKGLQTFELLEEEPDTYRCSLHAIEFMSFEVVPVIDVRLTHTTNGCTVEMLSCKFEGSHAMLQQQNEKFSAFMRNEITWDEESDSETCIDFDVCLGVNLQVFTKPFTLLPLSALETPGNLIMQGLLDRLVPSLVDQLLEDYNKWKYKLNP